MFGAAALVFYSLYQGHIGRIRGSACNQHVCGKRGVYAAIMVWCKPGWDTLFHQ
jgi:hypothetical protein